MKSQDETLEEWCRALLQAYELEDVQVDVNAILSLAGVAAHSVVRPAAPLTTFIAGFAAGSGRPGSGRPTMPRPCQRPGRGPLAGRRLRL